MATLHSIPGDAVAWREVDGEFVLISVETTHYYSLNSSGSDVWRILLEGPQTADSIAGALASRHGLDRARVGAAGGRAARAAARRRAPARRGRQRGRPRLAGAPPDRWQRGYEPPSLLKYEALERLILSGE